MKQNLAKIACGFAAAALAFTLAACDDSSSADNTSGQENEEISSESNGAESSDAIEDSDTIESSDSVESSAAEDNSSASLDDHSSSSMAIKCQAFIPACYSEAELCRMGYTQYCVGSSSSDNSSSSSSSISSSSIDSSSSEAETCEHVSDIDGGSCKDGNVVKDCATGAYAVCHNNGWTLAVIGDNCRPIGNEITVSDMIKLACNEDSYWEYEPVYNNCPPGNYSCQPPNYDCETHPINGFSCNEGNDKVYQLTVTTRGAGDCQYQCSGGTYRAIMDVAPVGN